MNNFHEALIKKIEGFGVVPVLAIGDAEKAVEICQMLDRAGVGVAELTFRVEGAAEAIAAVRKALPDFVVGAGTVLNPSDYQKAIDAGASFVVSPGLNMELIQLAKESGSLYIPGVATPTEMEMGLREGVKTFKIFPAEAAGGVALIKAMTAPYLHLGVRVMPTGGISFAQLESYLSLPVVFCVGGSWLTDEAKAKESADFVKKIRS